VKPIIIISGAPPGPSGTGRFVAYLEEQGATLLCAPKLKEPKTHMLREGKIFSLLIEIVVFYINKVIFLFRFKQLEKNNSCHIVLLHPQFIGMRRTIRFIKNSPAEISFYILDNSYFCVRSYNHIPGTNKPCLECLGGDLHPQQSNNCMPHPIRSDYAMEYVTELKTLVQKDKVKLMAQCQSQAALAQRHFNRDVPVVGLWANDWNEVFEDKIIQEKHNETWDVVFHGFSEEAKGAQWLLEVASYCPQLTFLFPFPKSWLTQKSKNKYDNCTFRFIKWETGLKEIVSSAGIVIAPSLWSAAVEGSLVKSLVISNAVAVVNAEGSYSEELPDGLLIKLPKDAKQAAKILKEAVKQKWQTDKTIKKEWIQDFESKNRKTMDAIKNIVNSNSRL
jgi:hypothetical protein